MKAVDSDVDIVVSGVECGGTVALLTWPRVVRGWHRDLNSRSVWSVWTRTRRKRGTDTADAGLQMALLILSASACYLRYHSDLHDTLIAQLFE